MGTRDIRGVDTSPPSGEPRRYVRQHGTWNNQPPEVIRSGKHPDGQERHGINPDNVHTSGRKARYLDGAKHRAALRGDE
jgi:hypothetical protein